MQVPPTLVLQQEHQMSRISKDITAQEVEAACDGIAATMKPWELGPQLRSYVLSRQVWYFYVFEED